MCDQRRLRPACAYAQSDQRLCLSLGYSMTVKLLTKHHLEFLSLKGGRTGSSSLHLSKCNIIGNHMSRLICQNATLLEITCHGSYVKMQHCWKSHVTAHMSNCHIVGNHMSRLICQNATLLEITCHGSIMKYK